MKRSTSLLLALLLLLPGVAFSDSIRELNTLTSPALTHVMEIDTGAGTTEGTHFGKIAVSDLLALITDAQIPNTITVSNYLALAGGTMTGELVLDEVGVEFQETDGITNCSGFSSTGGGIFYDDSEGRFKKCQDGTLTDLDTGGGGGGEANTASNLGGALGVFDSKSSVDLRFNGFAAADFDLGSNVFSIDDATWLNEAELDTYAELNAQIADQNLLHEGLIDTEADFEALLFAVVTPSEVATTLEKSFTFYHSSDLTTYDGVAKVQFANAVTITSIDCATDTGTATINYYERNETTPNTGTTDGMANFVCDTSPGTPQTSFTDAAIDADDWLTIHIDAVASSPTVLNITVKYTLQ